MVTSRVASARGSVGQLLSSTPFPETGLHFRVPRPVREKAISIVPSTARYHRPRLRLVGSLYPVLGQSGTARAKKAARREPRNWTRPWLCSPLCGRPPKFCFGETKTNDYSHRRCSDALYSICTQQQALSVTIRHLQTYRQTVEH